MAIFQLFRVIEKEIDIFDLKSNKYHFLWMESQKSIVNIV